MSKSFNLSFDVDVTLTVEELWPDGDAPENPTVADVEALIDKYGGWLAILRGRNLVEGECRAQGDLGFVREVTPYVPRSQRTK